MNIFAKMLTVSLLTVVLTACSGAEENDENNTANNTNDADNEQNEGNNDDDLNNEAANTNSDQENSSEDNQEDEAETGEPPATVNQDTAENELVFEKDGEEYSKEAKLYETDFGKEIKLLEGMEAEYDEAGNKVTADFSVNNDEHEMDGLTFTVEEAFSYDGDTIMTQDVDVDYSLGIETSLVENASHVDDFNVYTLKDDETPFQI